MVLSKVSESGRRADESHRTHGRFQSALRAAPTADAAGKPDRRIPEEDASRLVEMTRLPAVKLTHRNLNLGYVTAVSFAT
jgi:hypothetical protein